MFKYQTYFEELKTLCPPSNYTAQNKNAFRWIFDDVNDENNFKPVFFKNPKRFNEKSDEAQCMAMGLSFFDSLETAERRFLHLKKRLGEEVSKVLGSQITQGQIQEEDGVSNASDINGHFTHHPSIYFKYFENNSIVKQLR